MLKIKGKTLSGFIFDDEFESVAEFIQLQLEDFPAMDDSVEILNVEIDEEIYHFMGNAGELYYELTKK
ncbi:DUF4649 domain-containing protein [Lactococcus protaetiae]|uniref:DUF4649 domain-containing protein n=1 Tax=Lactococcus protaetiae TaxID=2592653 RepID=A0A514Z7I5_9LACT|nr:DUF4649 domain-containing protein [Lactococcus protaetiae]MCL2113174.1 DUF4649 domain-containing protein [Streptococcaceae bacterium]QDK70546.1 DUF4649 domain-containing protein [Lactococcus protaetiae]